MTAEERPKRTEGEGRVSDWLETGGSTIAPKASAAAWAEFKAKMARVEPFTGEKPKKLKMADIFTLRGVFQQRATLKPDSRKHIDTLAATAKAGERLEPIVVYRTYLGWTVIDGHHRLDAYRAARWRGQVPVRVFEGTPEQAVVVAGKANSRAKLQMRQDEKSDAAWRMVTWGDDALTNAQIHLAHGVSERTVTTMRAARRKLLSAGAEDLDAMTWAQARKESGEFEAGEFDMDEATKALTARLLRHFPHGRRSLTVDLDLLGRALSLYAGTTLTVTDVDGDVAEREAEAFERRGHGDDGPPDF